MENKPNSAEKNDNHIISLEELRKAAKGLAGKLFKKRLDKVLAEGGRGYNIITKEVVF